MYLTTIMGLLVSPRHLDLFSLLTDLTRSLRCCQQDQVFCADLSFAQFSVLNAIAERGEMRLADLHRLLYVEKSTTTRLITPLTRRGLIEKKKSQRDSRAQILKVTREGEVLHQKIWECLVEFIGKIEGEIPQGRRKEVYRQIRIFISALRSACNGRGGKPSTRRRTLHE